MEPRGSLGMFVGNDVKSDSYLILTIHNKLIRSKNVRFFENQFTCKRETAHVAHIMTPDCINAVRLELDKVLHNDEHTVETAIYQQELRKPEDIKLGD